MNETFLWPLELRGIVFCGCSAVGKTSLVCELIKRKQIVFVKPVEYIIYVYESDDSKFEQFKSDPNITFTTDIFKVDEHVRPNQVGLVIFDDKIIQLEQSSSAAQYLTQFFVYRATHEQLIPIFLCHNLFSKPFRTLSLNSGYIVLFKAVRDKRQISVLGSQLGVGNFLSIALDLATAESSYGFLLLDLTTNQKDCFRFRTFIWPTGGNDLFYLPDK